MFEKELYTNHCTSNVCGGNCRYSVQWPFLSLVADLDLLVQELSPAQQKWEDIGRELGVKQKTLRDIRTNYSDLGGCLRVMLREKVKRGCISWKYIISILRTPYIRESNLADQLEEKYCPSEYSLMIVIVQYIIALEVLCSSIDNNKLSINTMLEC